MKKDIRLLKSDLEIRITGKSQRLRLTNGWTDWMLDMNDVRDMVIQLNILMVDELFKTLTINFNKVIFTNKNSRQELLLSREKKIVRRVGPGLRRKEYQTVALFVKNKGNNLPPSPFKISLKELSKIMVAMITLDKPREYCIKDSLRNYQYLLAMLWMKKTDEKLLKGQKKLAPRDIFRLGIP